MSRQQHGRGRCADAQQGAWCGGRSPGEQGVLLVMGPSMDVGGATHDVQALEGSGKGKPLVSVCTARFGVRSSPVS